MDDKPRTNLSDPYSLRDELSFHIGLLVDFLAERHVELNLIALRHLTVDELELEYQRINRFVRSWMLRRTTMGRAATTPSASDLRGAHYGPSGMHISERAG